MNQIDLSKDGHRLDEIFASVINKLPDLRLPPSFKLAEEEDFFNKTSSIRLLPFRKQKYFDEKVKQKKDQLNHIETYKFKRIRESLLAKAQCSNRNEAGNQSFKIPRNKRQPKQVAKTPLLDFYPIEVEKQKSKFERLKMARCRYSRCRIKKKEPAEEVGFNKLFVESPQKGYPFAEPIPESMRTNNDIDNLKDIVVMKSIDWKMLTPVRPSNEKEEKYFDRLVLLHRKRHDEQKKLKQHPLITDPPFRHIRYKYLMQCNSRNKEVFVQSVHRIPEPTYVETTLGSQSDIIKSSLRDIPKLTVSGEGGSADPNLNQFKRHFETLNCRYKSTQIKREATQPVDDETKSKQNETLEDLMDERIEEIVENLMNASLDVEIE